LLHQNTAIYAGFVSCSNLSLILVRNAVCVGHGRAATRLVIPATYFSVIPAAVEGSAFPSPSQFLLSAF
jgi:hypothetical protein